MTTIIRTLEAVVDENGEVRLISSIHLPSARRALVTILDEKPGLVVAETALLSEQSLADWNRPEEDAAWSYLQSDS